MTGFIYIMGYIERYKEVDIEYIYLLYTVYP